MAGVLLVVVSLIVVAVSLMMVAKELVNVGLEEDVTPLPALESEPTDSR